jgi:hypothetical protein
MAIVDDPDVQVHLPYDKLKIEEIPDDLAKCKLDTERIVRGYLAEVIPAATMALWTAPTNVPEVIRAAAGRLCAALIYRTRYSEQSLDDPQFAQNKYDEAMAMLQGIIDGSIIVDGVVTVQFDNTYFWPNDSTGEPVFTMDGRY